MNTRFYYSNDNAGETTSFVIFAGKYTAKMVEQLISLAYGPEVGFNAQQVGIPPLGPPCCPEHGSAWHYFEELDSTESAPTDAKGRTIEQFVAEFVAAGQEGWKEPDLYKARGYIRADSSGLKKLAGIMSPGDFIAGVIDALTSGAERFSSAFGCSDQQIAGLAAALQNELVPTVMISIKSGSVADVIADRKVKVLLADFDTEGAYEEDLAKIPPDDDDSEPDECYLNLRETIGNLNEIRTIKKYSDAYAAKEAIDAA